MRRTSLSQTVPHSEDYLGDEEDNLGDEEDNTTLGDRRRTSLSQTVPHSEDNLGDEEDKFITNSTTLGRQSRR